MLLWHNLELIGCPLSKAKKQKVEVRNLMLIDADCDIIDEAMKAADRWDDQRLQEEHGLGPTDIDELEAMEEDESGQPKATKAKAGSRVVVVYKEEEEDSGMSVDKEYSGVVVQVSSSKGMLIAFDEEGEEVDEDSSFMDIGMESIEVTKLAQGIQKLTGRELGEAAIFENDSARALASRQLCRAHGNSGIHLPSRIPAQHAPAD